MKEIRIGLNERSYTILIKAEILDALGETLSTVAPHQQCALFCDSVVRGLYAARATEALKSRYSEVLLADQESGEEHKNLETVTKYYSALLKARLERGSPIIALGGGVTGDTVGFVAATYLRGVPLVQVPTTLLAMVDSSVGGKVGVNVPEGKNLIGAFYQPKAVLIDPSLLESLPAREFSAGLAECIKHGMIKDASLVSWMEANLPGIQSRDATTLEELIERNVRIKAAVVEADEREGGVRAILNFGHTFAHALERVCGYGEIHHGEAVGLGMLAASTFSARLGLCDSALVERLAKLIAAVGLPLHWDLPSVSELCESMLLDKKVKDGKLRLILPNAVGSVMLVDQFPESLLVEAWQSIAKT